MIRNSKFPDRKNLWSPPFAKTAKDGAPSFYTLPGKMGHPPNKESLSAEAKSSLIPTIKKLERSLLRLGRLHFSAKPLASIPAQKRRTYEHLFGLIYECSTNQVVAKSLVDKLLSKLAIE